MGCGRSLNMTIKFSFERRKVDCVHANRQSKVQEKRYQGLYHFFALISMGKNYHFFPEMNNFCKSWQVETIFGSMVYFCYTLPVFDYWSIKPFYIPQCAFAKLTNGYTRVLYFPTCQRDSKALRKDQDICRSFRFVKFIWNNCESEKSYCWQHPMLKRGRELQIANGEQ